VGVVSLGILGLAVLLRAQVPLAGTDRGAIAAVGLLTLVVVVHGSVGALYYNVFSTARFWPSVASAWIVVAGAIALARLAVLPSPEATDAGVRLAFVLLLGNVLVGLLGWSPFHVVAEKPVFLFPEPSGFADAFLPVLMYVVVSSPRRRQAVLLAVALGVSLVLENLTLVVGTALVAAVIARSWLKLGFVAGVLIAAAVTFGDIAYYTSRLAMSREGGNLSTLSYLQGWERAILAVEFSGGAGVGFQQFGVVGPKGQIQEDMATLGAPDLNLLDGSTVGSKLVAEFGVGGIALLVAYLFAMVRMMGVLRARADGRLATRPRELWFQAMFVMYGMVLFVRGGAGYFSGSTFMFLAALYGLAQREPDPETGAKRCASPT
jgi:hypothetical protein